MKFLQLNLIEFNKQNDKLNPISESVSSVCEAILNAASI